MMNDNIWSVPWKLYDTQTPGSYVVASFDDEHNQLVAKFLDEEIAERIIELHNKSIESRERREGNINHINTKFLTDGYCLDCGAKFGPLGLQYSQRGVWCNNCDWKITWSELVWPRKRRIRKT